MRFFSKIFVFTAVLTSLSRCGGGPQSQAVEAAPKPSRRHALARGEYLRDSAQFQTETRPHNLDVVKYNVRGLFDWKKHTLNATLDITFQVLDTLDPTVVLDSRIEKLQSISTLSGMPIPYTETEGEIEINLSNYPTIAKSNQVTLRIAYEALAGTGSDENDLAMEVIGQRQGDPVTARVLYTHSEPKGAAYWMPCHNTPKDRARFSLELLLPKTDSLFANGRLLHDTPTPDGKNHWVRYETDHSLPTYLMAFAMGEFQTRTRKVGMLPVSVVYRQGLRLEADKILDMIGRQMKLFEKMLGPYPFEKYSIVFLPDFPAQGMENAGITFENEVRGSRPDLLDDDWLSAHELAHHWFGNLVTISDWDDLWIKEGMANLMTQESRRPTEDPHQSGRLMASNCSVVDGEAVQDPSLPPDEKYNSGPYDRSNWLIAQLRSAVGEKAFWNSIRQLLNTYRFQAIGTKEFLTAFSNVAPAELLSKFKVALRAKQLPRLIVNREEAGKLSVTLKDPEGALIVPLSIALISPTGSKVLDFFSGTKHTFAATDFIALEPKDRHPVLDFLGKKKEMPLDWHRLSIPRTLQERQWLLSGPPHFQTYALGESSGWALTPSEFSAFYAGLSSEEARVKALRVACDLGAKSSDKTAWATQILKAMARPPTIGLLESDASTLWASCSALPLEKSVTVHWAEIGGKPETTSLSEAALLWLTVYAQTPANALATWGPMGEKGYTVRARKFALDLLRRHLGLVDPMLKTPAPDLPKWRDYFERLVVNNEVTELSLSGLEALTAMGSLSSLPVFRKVILENSRMSLRQAAVCEARALTENESKAWDAFVSTLGPLEALPEHLRKFIVDKTKCDSYKKHSNLPTVF